jgi:hypothetical protein
VSKSAVKSALGAAPSQLTLRTSMVIPRAAPSTLCQGLSASRQMTSRRWYTCCSWLKSKDLAMSVMLTKRERGEGALRQGEPGMVALSDVCLLVESQTWTLHQVTYRTAADFRMADQTSVTVTTIISF